MSILKSASIRFNAWIVFTTHKLTEKRKHKNTPQSCHGLSAGGTMPRDSEPPAAPLPAEQDLLLHLPAPDNSSDSDLEAMLTTLALGHALARSKSPLACLPRDIISLHIARHVRSLYQEDLARRGLLTPVHLIQRAASPPQRRLLSRLVCLAASAGSSVPQAVPRAVRRQTFGRISPNGYALDN